MSAETAPEADRARLFVALVPAPAQQRSLAEAAETLRHGGRPVPAAALHMTLAFLGAVQRERLPALESALGGVRGETFELALERVGQFPRPRVLWCAATGAPGALYALQGAVVQAVAAAGLTMEARPFTPHVTVARKVSRYSGPPRLARPVLWRLDRFQLMESRTLPTGARYRTVRAFPLQK